jgi:hypothetical protein
MTTIDWWATAQVIFWTMVPFLVGLFIGLLSSNRMDEWDDDGELTDSEAHQYKGDRYGV